MWSCQFTLRPPSRSLQQGLCVPAHAESRNRAGLRDRRPPAAGGATPTRLRAGEPVSIAGFLDPEEDPSLYVADAILAKHWPGLDLVRADDRRSACFIAGYGQRYVASGSFLVTPRGVRRFSPAEIARLLGLPADFRFPADVSRERRYRLLGNALSIPAARWVLDQLAD